ncbi:hypothetical protein [Natronorubrum thiooxidans]|uniref:hypothetical protein n=1 Tax=Natronorubrum thiooxidans TaxID=308853 RepID=UPI0009716A43|nr:hypothetical protein [Natronorubrum thiooxidans]
MYAATLAVGMAFYIVQWRRECAALIVAAVPASYYLYFNYLLDFFVDTIYRGHRGNEGFLDFIIFSRAARIREQERGARTGYLIDHLPETLTGVVAFAPVGAIYFLYVPFPWMVETPIDLIVSLEGLVAMAYTVFAAFGVWYMRKRQLPATVALIAGFLTFVVIYGFISVNVGTSVRQRQPIIWVLFLFGGIGLAERFEGQLEAATDRLRDEYTTRVAPLYAREEANEPTPTKSDTVEEADELDLSEYKQFPRNERK